jgi:hypothetical protein
LLPQAAAGAGDEGNFTGEIEKMGHNAVSSVAPLGL